MWVTWPESSWQQWVSWELVRISCLASIGNCRLVAFRLMALVTSLVRDYLSCVGHDLGECFLGVTFTCSEGIQWFFVRRIHGVGGGAPPRVFSCFFHGRNWQCHVAYDIREDSGSSGIIQIKPQDGTRHGHCHAVYAVQI